MQGHDYFTNKAKKILYVAQDETIKLSHKNVGPEHLFLAVIIEKQDNVAEVLDSCSVTYEKTRQALSIAAKNEIASFSLRKDLTPLAKLVLRLAVEEAQGLRQEYVGMEHILLGILSIDEGIILKVFSILKIDRLEMKTALLSRLKGRKPSEQKESRTPTLDKYGTDISEKAKKGKLDPVIGRHKEIERIIHILCRRNKNNPVLIGEPGVGKTAIVEGLAQQILSRQVPEILFSRRIVLLSLASVIAGARFRGEFEERLNNIAKECCENDDIILFIDEMHTIVGAGAAEGSVDASNILKPSLARGDMQVIGATTLKEYKKHVEKDSALERRFQPVFVEEPSVDETIEILRGLRDRYEEYHRIKYSDKALESAAKLAKRYIADRFLPDKAIDLIDEAGAYLRLKQLSLPPEIVELEEQLQILRKEEEEASANENFEEEYRLYSKIIQVQTEIEIKKAEWEADRVQNCSDIVTAEHIARVVSSWTGIPVCQLTEADASRMRDMDNKLRERVIGQEEAIESVCASMKRSMAKLTDPRRPIGSFIFLGPTGVGKTELAKSLAWFIYNDENSIIRVDMSEYMEKHTVSRFIGSPPGYVGHEDGGQLTEQIRRKPYSVLLFDEIEKAHPDVFNILLQILEDGRLTDGQGRVVNFKNTVIIMTSNLGANLVGAKKIGYENETEEENYEGMKQRLIDELKKTFRPEFLNRIDDVVVFRPLNKNDIKQIVDIMLKDINIRLQDNLLTVNVETAAKEILAEKGFDPKLGARPLRRTIQQLIENPIADIILEMQLNSDCDFTVKADENNQLVIETNPSR